MNKLIVFFTLIILMLGGCKPRERIVRVPEIRTEYKDRIKYDSIYNSDTTLIYIKGDTVYQDKIRWRNRYVNVSDSVIVRDSIPYPVEVVEYVNQLTKWQKIRLQILNVMGGIIALWGAFKIGRRFI